MRLCFLYSPIAFGTHRPPIDLSRLDDRGLTGTDLVSTKLPLAMAARGHDVTLYMDRAVSHAASGVRVMPFTEWCGGRFDAAIATSNPNALEHCSQRTARLVNRQVATFGIDAKRGWQGFTDLVMCPSAWARDLVRGPLGDDAPRFDVLPNGCDAEPARATKIPGRCLYISSPDRGLHWLLSAWPHIKRRVPHATLRIAYESIGSWLAFHTQSGRKPTNKIDAEQIRRACYIEHALKRLAPLGVECVPGGVTHGALQTMLAEAEALLYPLDPLAPTETFGVAVLEAQLHGCVPVVSTADAFGELWAPDSASVPAPMRDRLGEWIEAAVRVLTDASYRAERAEACRRNAHRYTWARVAERLERIAEAEVERKRPVASVASRPVLDMVLTPYASGGRKIDLESQECGGCPAGFLGLGRAMAARGDYEVRLFSTFARNDAVQRPIEEYRPEAGRDVLLAYYDTSPLVGARGCLRIASHHTFRPPSPGSMEWADVQTAPSAYAARTMAPVFGGRWEILPNAIDSAALPASDPVPGRVIYHTSAGRGLWLLCEAWPAIRERVPHATLHVVGDPAGWVDTYRASGCRQGDAARRLAAALPIAEAAGGVEVLGRLPRARLDRELSQASCFAFPAAPVQPAETWSTSVLECLAVGVPVVICEADALGELWGGVCSVAKPEARSVAEEVCAVLLRGPGGMAARIEEGRMLARRYTFEAAAEALHGIIGKVGA